MTEEEKAALQVVAAHLVYLEKTEEMVKRTQGMMDEVLKDKTMGLEEKIQALHMLTGHLTLLQESAKKTMEGMGMDTSEFDTEEKEEEEEDELAEKMRKTPGATGDKTDIKTDDKAEKKDEKKEEKKDDEKLAVEIPEGAEKKEKDDKKDGKAPDE